MVPCFVSHRSLPVIEKKNPLIWLVSLLSKRYVPLSFFIITAFCIDYPPTKMYS